MVKLKMKDKPMPLFKVPAVCCLCCCFLREYNEWLVLFFKGTTSLSVYYTSRLRQKSSTHSSFAWMLLGTSRKPLFCVADERKSHRTSGGCHHQLSFTTIYSVLFRLVRLNRLSVPPGWPFPFFWLLFPLLGRWNNRQGRSLFRTRVDKLCFIP